jgi:hypothetical protein
MNKFQDLVNNSTLENFTKFKFDLNLDLYSKFNTNTFNPMATNDGFNINLEEKFKENNKPEKNEKNEKNENKFIPDFESRRKGGQPKTKQVENINEFNMISSRRKKLVI